jgi:hypothetical protein
MTASLRILQVLSGLEYNKRSMIVYIVSGDMTHAFNIIFFFFFFFANQRTRLLDSRKKKIKLCCFA